MTYTPEWKSLCQYQPPEWYKNAKFGIFIHWGVYSVPAYGSEWYSRNMYIQGSPEFEHHIKTYGPHRVFGYKDFIPMFKAEKFDPEQWAELFKCSGAEYVIPVAEHHDGFQMYKSGLSHWNSFEMGPKRDVVGELKTAVENRGMALGVSSHRIEHYFFMGHGKDFESDIHEPLKRGDLYWPSMREPSNHFSPDEAEPSEEFLDDWLDRCKEIVDQYKPRVFYFDWWIIAKKAREHLKRFAAYYYNQVPDGVINYKHDSFAFGCGVPDMERGHFSAVQPYCWQTDTSVARNSWCYTENNSYKSAAEIIRVLVDVVSKNGNLLLNIGPKSDGTIPDKDKAILLEIGQWLKTNGEGIYGARPWRAWGEGKVSNAEGQFSENTVSYTGEDFRFTSNNGCIYAYAMNWQGSALIRSLAVKNNGSGVFQGIIDKAEVLGWDGDVSYSSGEDGLRISAGIRSDKPVCFKITVL